ncbi:MAG: DUF4129 domain-containing transglutaminase family protein, partial [Polyangiaceae bacterium]
LEPLDPPVIFLPARAAAIHARAQGQAILSEPLAIQKGPEGEFRYSGNDGRGLRYEVLQGPANETFPETLSNTDMARYLSVPASLPSRIGMLAHEWSDALPDDMSKARAIETHLRHDFHYDMTAPSSGTKQPLDNFLFVTRRGHCEFFSTAMAIMLREIGIPSRNVVGFVGGTYNRFGHDYAIREQDSHSWVEAYVAGGWQTFDPTPAAGLEPQAATTGVLVYIRDLLEAMSQGWDRNVVRYNLQTQVGLFEAFSRRYENARRSAGLSQGTLGKITRAPVLAGILAVFAIGGYAMWSRRRYVKKKAPEAPPQLEKRYETAAALYRALDGALSVQGIGRPVWLPPLRHARELVDQKHPLASEVLELTNVYLGARFGDEELSELAARDFERRVREIRSARREQKNSPALST